ncbi:hypothetical protein A5N83_03665 [Rhodococcus sp. 1139]|nr:hypothetical protein A5N83_03665 [Rhodococcus sp. 1139]
MAPTVPAEFMEELTLGHGIAVGHGCVELLMRAAGVKGLSRNQRALPSISLHLERSRGPQIHPRRAEQAGVTDITEHPTPWIPAI